MSSHDEPLAATILRVADAKDIPVNAVDGKPTLFYWDICGLAQPIRYALELAGAPYVDVRIDAGDATSEAYKQNWFARKPEVPCHFANLPFYATPDSTTPQSNAILRRVARDKPDAFATEDDEKLDVALAQATDLDNVFTGSCYRDPSALHVYFKEKLPGALAQWADFLGDSPFLAGAATPTVADCKFYEILRKLKIFASETDGLKESDPLPPALAAYVARFEAIPAIKAYQASPNFLARPLNNPHAKFR